MTREIRRNHISSVSEKYFNRERSAREVRDPMKSDAQRKLLRCKSVIKLKERAHEGGAGWAGPRPGQDGPHQKKKK